MPVQTEKTISETIDKDYSIYANYVLENRAIPCYIDGFKPVHRKLLYAMLNEHKGKRTKISDLGGISRFGYHHAESSAMGAAVTMAADWNNNVPVFKQHGAFGTRLIPAAAAPRYIFAELNPDFYNFFTDFDVVEYHEDLEDNPEPKCYLPLIPWVLVNGLEGIAIGFACRFLSHHPKDLAALCIKELNGKLKDDEILKPHFKNFKGIINTISHNKYETIGVVNRIKRNTYEITELPWGITKEKYFNTLLKLEENGLIKDFEDNCSKDFNFIITLSNEQDKKCADNPIEYFKLSKTYTENYTALDENGKLIIFDNKIQIIKKFIQFRVKKVKDQIDFDIAKCQKDLNWLKIKLAFVQDNLSDKIDYKKTTKKELIQYCINSYTNIDNTLANKLVTIPILDITTDMVSNLESKINELESKILELESLVPSQVLKDKITELTRLKYDI